ncbi:MAG: hypothetical protein AAFX54_10275 [Pseudomonadota bacterium]
MKTRILFLSAVGLFSSAAFAQSPMLEAGQVWTTNVNAAPELRIYIGALDDEEEDLAHISITGIPDLKKSPSLLIELSPDEPITQKHIPYEEGDYYFRYEMKPNKKGDGVSVSVIYMPMQQSVLAKSLLAIEEANVPPAKEFNTAMDNWDYLRDTYGINNTTSQYANEPLPDVVKTIKAVATSSFGFLKAVKEQFGGLPGRPKVETKAGKIKPRSDENED